MQPKRIIPIDINYLLVEYEEQISPSINAAVSQLWQAIEKKDWPGIISMVPTYRSLLIQFNPVYWTVSDLVNNVREITSEYQDTEISNARLVTLPVLYGGSHGPDLHDLAQYNNLSEDRVIEIHQANIYRVYMLGFNPGYPYLGGLDPSIAMPRLEKPRIKVPAGSVAIGGEQTGIYSTVSPGGWRIIGHTPVSLFDIKLENPVLLRAGDNIKFRAIEQQEYNEITEQIDNGLYQMDIM